MKVTQPYLLVLLRRSENEKTPLTVFPHEVEVLKKLHGEDSILETEDEPPVKQGEFDTEAEYARLESMYKGNERVPYPVEAALGDLDEFESSFEGLEEDTEKAALIAEAKELGLKATKNWGIEKLQTEIAAAKAAKGE